MSIGKVSKFAAALAVACSAGLPATAATESILQTGAGAYATITDRPSVVDGFSMSVWFKVTQEAGKGGDYDTIFGSCGRNNFNGPMTIYCNNTATAAKRGIGVGGKIGNTFQEVIYNKDLADGQWHFAVATLVGTTYTLYLDGAEVATKTCAGDVAGFGQNLQFGADAGSLARNFTGLVTEGALWARVLSDLEVEKLYSAGADMLRLNGAETGLWGYWALNDGEGTTAADKVNAHNATLKAATMWTDDETPFAGTSAKVTVAFEANDAAFIPDQVLIPGTKCVTLPTANPRSTTPGWIFKGWTSAVSEAPVSTADIAQMTFSDSVTWAAQFEDSGKTPIELPEVTSPTAYTGKSLKPAISEQCQAEWTGNWTDVGPHSATVSIVNKDEYIWIDGTEEDKILSLDITKAENAWASEPSVKAQWAKGEDPEIQEGEAQFGGVPTMTPGAGEVRAFDVGAHTVKFSVEGTANYAGIEKTIDVFVVPQGLGPTGDPDTEATTYTWTGEQGYWYDSNRWTSEKTPCFGFPANAFATALFDSMTNTVEGNTMSYELAELKVNSANVTLKGGDYAPAKLTFAGTTPTLALTDGAKLTPANEITLQYNKDVTLVITNATLNGNVHVYNGATNFRGSFHNATYVGNLSLSHNGTPTSDSNQSLVFSGTDSKLVFGTATTFANQGVNVRFERGVNMKFTSASGTAVAVGKNSKLMFVGDNVIDYSSYMFGKGDNAEIFFGAGSVMTNGFGLCDFGIYRNVSGLTNVWTVVSNATIKAGNQVYMPHPNRAVGKGCGVKFMGDSPRVTATRPSSNTVRIGKREDLMVDGEKLPSWLYVLPAAPYEVAPMVIQTEGRLTTFYSNTPIVLDVSAVKQKGRYPLFTFSDLPGDGGIDISALTEAMRAYVVRRGVEKDAKARVMLGWDEETKTIYADVAATPGLMLIVR